MGIASLDRETENVIGSGSSFKGRVRLEGDLHIDGKYEGDVLEVGSLTVGVGGKVKTNLRANTVIIGGIFCGEVVAKTRVLLLRTAKVLGNIQSKEFIIQAGAVYRGITTITTEAFPDTKVAIQEAYG